MDNSLYSISIISSSVNSLEAKVDLAATNPLYEGHFPGSPVLPGVIQLQIVRDILRKHFVKKIQMKEVRTCKFLGMINPLITRELIVSIKWTDDKDLDVIANIHWETVFLKAQLSYVLEE